MNPQTHNRIVGNINEASLREVAVEVLGLHNISPEAQDDIFSTIRESIVIYVQTAILKALGPEKVLALEEIPEEHDELFAKQLSALLPNIQEVVDGAVEQCILDNRKAFDEVLNKEPRTI